MLLVSLPNEDLPSMIGMVVDGILNASDLSNDEAQVSALSCPSLHIERFIMHVACDVVT